MTEEIRERADQIAVAEFGVSLDDLGEPNFTNTVRKAIEEIRREKLHRAVRQALGAVENETLPF